MQGDQIHVGHSATALFYGFYLRGEGQGCRMTQEEGGGWGGGGKFHLTAFVMDRLGGLGVKCEVKGLVINYGEGG